MSRCTFPTCPTPPTVRNRDGQDVCAYHQPVAIGSSWMGEGSHHAPEGDGE